MMQYLLAEHIEKFKKSQQHLAYSYRKVTSLPTFSEQSTEEELEVLESFASRFARASEMYVSRVLRGLALENDPAFRGSIIDLLHMGEKYGWIANAHVWRRIRELRNVAAHEYCVDDLASLYRELIALTPHILEITVQPNA